jgi:hypothetical protein
MKTFFLFLFILISNHIFSQIEWELSNSGIPVGYNAIDFAVSTNGDVYAICSKLETSSFVPKLLKSTNSGNSWVEITMYGLANVNNVNSIIFSGNTLLLSALNSATSNYDIYSSINNGQNWSLSNSGVPLGYNTIDFTVSSNGDVYAACSKLETSSFVPKLLKSTNSGNSWVEITMSGLANVNNVNSIIFSGNTLLLSALNSATSNYDIYSSSSLSGYLEISPLISNLKVFPNPSNGFINVAVSRNNIVIKNIEIISIYGTVIKIINTDFNSINISDLPNGIYFLKVHYGKAFELIKITKN